VKTKAIAFSVLLLSCTLSAWALPAEPTFDPPSGVYPDADGSVTVAISADPGCTIWYTTDGSRPVSTNASGESVTSATARIYSGPVTLANGRETGPDATSLIMTGENENDPYDPWYAPAEPPRTIPVLRAAALDEAAGEVSPVASATYLLGDMATRYGKTPVVSISTEWSDLWAAEEGAGYGIYRYPLASKKNKVPGAYVEFFENGARQFARWIELRIQGTSTLKRPKKSLRLTGAKAYTPVKIKKSPFSYKFFPDKDCETFSCVVLRMGGNDWNQGVVRDMLSQAINKHGIVDVQYGNACIVFLNGVYWGVNEIRERWEPGYFKYQHGLGDEEFTLMEYGDGEKYPKVDQGLGEDDDDPFATRAYLDFNGILRTIDGTYTNNLSGDERWQWFTNCVNPDSVIQHFGATLFSGNGDWPQNNQRFWRAWDTGIDPARDPLCDGRWNWTFHDCDFAFTLPFDYANDFRTGTFAAFDPYTFLYPDSDIGTVGEFFDDAARIFTSPVETNEKFRNRYLAYVYFSLATAWRHDVTSAVLQECADLFREAGMDENGLRWRQPQTAADWEKNIADIDRYLAARPEAYGWQTRRHFGLGPLRDLVLDIEGDGAIEAGTLTFDRAGSTPGTAFPLDVAVPNDVAVELTAVPAKGAAFLGWYETTANLPEAEPAATAEDCAANYASQPYPASSQGTGWGPWVVETNGTAGTWAGESQYAPIHLRSENGASFGIWANGDGHIAVRRELADGASLAVGQTMSIDVGFGRAGEPGEGVAFVTAGDASRPVELILASGGAEGEGYRLLLNGKAYTVDNFPHVVGMPVRLSLTHSTAGNYILRLSRGEETYAAAVAIPEPVTGVRLYKNPYGDHHDWWNLWFDRLRVAADSFGDGAELLATEMGDTIFYEDGNSFANWTAAHDTSTGWAGSWQNTEKLCNIGLPSFGLWANSGGTAKIRRHFGFALSTNYVLSVDFQNNALSEDGSSAGINFLTADGESFTFLAAKGQSNYLCVVDGNPIDTGVPVRSTGLRLAATVTGGNSISLDISGTVLPLAADGAVTGIEVFNASCGNGPPCNVFANRVWVTKPAGSAAPEPIDDPDPVPVDDEDPTSENGTLAFYEEGDGLLNWDRPDSEGRPFGWFIDRNGESAPGLQTNALGLWANSGGETVVSRNFSSAAGVVAASGVVVRFSFQNGAIAEESGEVGWELLFNEPRRTGYVSRVVGGVKLAYGETNYTWSDGTPLAAASTGAQHVRIAFLDETNALVSFLGTTQEVSFAAAPTGIRVFNRSAGDGSRCNVYVNHLAVWTDVGSSGGGDPGPVEPGETEMVFFADGEDLPNWDTWGGQDAYSGYGCEPTILFDGFYTMFFYANSGAESGGVRTLPDEVAFDAGWTFSFDFAHGSLPNENSSIGWALQNADGGQIVYCSVDPATLSYAVEANEGEAVVTALEGSVPVAGGTVHHVSLAFQSASRFTVSIDGVAAWEVESLLGAVRRLRFWNFNAGDGDGNNLLVNNLFVYKPATVSVSSRTAKNTAVAKAAPRTATETLLSTERTITVTATNAVSLIARFTEAPESPFEAWAKEKGVEPWSTNVATGVSYPEEYLRDEKGMASLQSAAGGRYTMCGKSIDGIALAPEVNEELADADGWRDPRGGELTETPEGSGVYEVSPTNAAGTLFIRLKLSPAE
jgi:hypothetical protein